MQPHIATTSRKTILITIGDGEVSKSVLQTEIFRILREKVCLVLLVHPRKLGFYREKFRSDSVIIDAMPTPSSVIIEELWSDLFLYSLHTESIRIKIEYSYLSGGSSLGKWIKLVLWHLGRLRTYRSVCRVAYRLMSNHSYNQLLQMYRPDLVWAANMTSMDDARLLKAARKRGIPSIGMPKCWDNLTLKTFLPVFPDKLLVQTELMKKDAERLDYPSDSISVVGFPKFDVYADRALLLSRDVFMEKFDFDPKRPLILYAGAGDQLAPHDEEILADLLDAIEKGIIPGSPQVLVRPHPKYVYRAETIPNRPFWALDRPGSSVGSSSDFEFSKDDVIHLMNSLYHADILIHTASTLGVEAAIFDRPMITLAYDGHAKLPDALSVNRYYSYDHLRRVLATSGMSVVHSFDELLQAIVQALKDPSGQREGRARIVRENAYMIDGKAGVRVAEALIEEVNI